MIRPMSAPALGGRGRFDVAGCVPATSVAHFIGMYEHGIRDSK